MTAALMCLEFVCLSRSGSFLVIWFRVFEIVPVYQQLSLFLNSDEIDWVKTQWCLNEGAWFIGMGIRILVVYGFVDIENCDLNQVVLLCLYTTIRKGIDFSGCD